MWSCCNIALDAWSKKQPHTCTCQQPDTFQQPRVNCLRHDPPLPHEEARGDLVWSCQLSQMFTHTHTHNLRTNCHLLPCYLAPRNGRDRVHSTTQIICAPVRADLSVSRDPENSKGTQFGQPINQICIFLNQPNLIFPPKIERQVSHYNITSIHCLDERMYHWCSWMSCGHGCSSSYSITW